MTAKAESTEFWIHEYISPWDFYGHGVSKILAHARTPYQQMYIVETGLYGKGLVLDGKWQSCTGDEFLYHEPLVHPAMLLHGLPKRVLILGGGEGATAREVLRWRSVEQVAMVDIDGMVVEACREHLPEMHQGAFDDPKLQLVIGDAIDFLENVSEPWDVIISDLSDPIEEGPSFKLFTKEYFLKARQALADGGVFVVQAGPVSPSALLQHARLVRTLRDVYSGVASIWTAVPTYAAPWSFALAADRTIDTRPDPANTDRALTSNTSGGLRMLDGESLLGMYQLPLHLRQAIANEEQVYTLSAPPKFYGKGLIDMPSPTG